jgi:hypothetical protein
MNNPDHISESLETSVTDPWHFGIGVDPDPDLDPRIHASDLLLFSSLTFKMPTKN